MTKGFLSILAGLLAIVCLANCKQTKNNSSPAINSTVLDTSTIAEVRQRVNTTVDSVNAMFPNNPTKHHAALLIDGVTDTVDYWYTPSRARISWSYSTAERDRWPTLFLFHGDLIKVRYREYNKTPPDTFAIEVNLYYDAGNVHNAEYRKVMLPNKLAPYAIRQLPYRDTVISKKELDNWFYPMVDQLLEAVENKTIDLTKDQ